MQPIRYLGLGGAGIPDVLPKAIAELQGLTISGPLTGGGANTAIAVSGIELGMSILKALLYTAGVPSDITANISIVDRRASGTLTLASVVAGDTVVVDGKTFTFVVDPGFAGNIKPYQVAVGETDTLSAKNLVTALMSGDSNLQASSSGAVVTVFWRVLGAVGNAVTLVGGAHVTASAATLTNGTDTQAIKVSVDTTGNLIVLHWYNKSLVVYNIT
jgi:hypothetical protein